MYSSVYRPTCSYRDCRNKVATKTYFELPSEHSRREIWIKNSGISEAEAAKIILDRRPIFICEEHFDQRHMQYLQDGRKILLNHPSSNPIPWQTTPDTTNAFPYDEQATQMLQIFESNNTEQDLYDYIFARNYVQTEAQAPTNEQLMILNQNYMLQAAQLQQQSQFLAASAGGGHQTSHQLQQIRANTQDRPKQQRRPRTQKPKTQYVQEEPEPPKKDVLCFSVKSNELIKDGSKASSIAASTSSQHHPSDPGSLDIEEQIETYYIMNEKNGKQSDINTIIGN